MRRWFPLACLCLSIVSTIGLQASLAAPAAAQSLWLNARGGLGDEAWPALALLESAATQGLNPEDYEAARLGAAARALASASQPLVMASDELDAALTASVLRYLHDLHHGRVGPEAVGMRLGAVAPADTHDLPALLRAAVASRSLASLAESLTPPLTQYQRLRAVLAQYRALDARALPLPSPSASAVRPGDTYDDAPILREWLASVGDLLPDAALAEAGATYDDSLVDGVKSFQLRHGLAVDGVLGPRTMAALGTPPGQRILQIELAMERLRWLGDLTDERLIALNIPMFRLWAWDRNGDEAAPRLDMRAIVGRAARTETPVFAADLREVIFRPFWNVPLSIQRGELVPLIARDPQYLPRHDMEIVRGDGDSAPVVPYSDAALAGLRAGTYRLRQRPGANNALGLVKFDFPNEDSIYMHGTPARELFALARRDFSHGCVRLEDPAAMASWALEGAPEWDRERIDAAMHGAATVRVPLARPIRVVLFYTTAVAVPEDGLIHFADDLYGHDARLARAIVNRTVVHSSNKVER